MVKVVERVVEKVVVRQDAQCLYNLARACRRIVAATERPMEPGCYQTAPVVLGQVEEAEVFPKMAEIERAMIVAAYERSNHKPMVAAHLLGIGKTTFYRKLKKWVKSPRNDSAAVHLTLADKWHPIVMEDGATV
jgi:transcriptional regulator of acetoin/glycerol metabolism